MRRLLVGLLALSVASPLQAMNPIFVKRSPCYAPRGFAVRGTYGVSNASNGAVTQLGAQLASPIMNGVFLKVQWAGIEPSQGVYDWRAVDADVATLKAAGKTYILDVYGTGLAGLTNGVTGNTTQTDTPAWVFAAGVAHLDTLDYRTDANCGNPIRLALPWDATYQTLYTDLVAHMAAHFGSDPALKGVAMNIFPMLTGEAGYTVQNNNTQVTCGSGQVIGPTDLTAQWKGVGYTAAKALSATQFMVGAYKTYFPSTELIYMFLAGGMPDIDASGNTDESFIYYDTVGLIPAVEAILGAQGSVQYNGFKMNPSAGTTGAIGNAAVAAHTALGYPGGFQEGGPTSIDSTDCQGAACQSSLQCAQNGGNGKGVPSGCLGWQVLMTMLDTIVSSNVDYYQPVGTTDIMTWNPSVTDPIWRAFNARCNQGSLLP